MIIRLKVILVAFCLISLSSFTFFTSTGYAQWFNFVEILTKQIEENPDLGALYLLRGVEYSDRKQHDLAIDDYAKAIELEPQFDAVYYYRAYSYVELGKYDLALNDCNKAIELESKTDFYYSERGYVEYKMGNFSQSVVDFTKAIELSPTANSYNGRGNGYGCIGQYSEASKDLEKAIQLDSKNGMAYFNLAQAYEKLGQKERALINYQKSSEIGVSNLQDTSQAKIAERLHGEWSTFTEWI